jgi:segregation and condensation protein A
MREAGVRLMALPQLGRDMFRRGSPEPVQINEKTIHQVSLFDLLKAYGEHQRRTKDPGPYMIRPLELHSIEEALERLQSLLGKLPSWTTLSAFLPANLGEGIVGRSAVAATLIAALELVKSGQAELRQATTFGPIHIRPRRQEISQ